MLARYTKMLKTMKITMFLLFWTFKNTSLKLRLSSNKQRGSDLPLRFFVEMDAVQQSRYGDLKFRF